MDNKLDKPVYINVYKNNSENPKAPTYSWSGFTFNEDIIIKAGTKVDITFWGNSINKDGKPNPHMRILNHVPRQDKGGVDMNRSINYPSKDQIAQERENDFLDDPMPR